MTEIKFRSRQSTEMIVVVGKNKGGMSYKELLKEHRRKGDFHIDDHFYVNRKGYVEAGRHLEDVAGFCYNDCSVAVHILADIDDKGYSDIQKQSIRNTINDIKKIYPGLSVIWK